MSKNQKDSWPLCAIQHPEHGRQFRKVHPMQTEIVLTGVWVENDAHPLGGTLGTVVLKRRVNTRNDKIPNGWQQRHAEFEFVKEGS